MSDNENSPVLRVTQLDTNELNESLLLTIKRSLNEDYFKYIQFKYIEHYRVEIFAGLKFILWYYTYGTKNQTVGQSVFDWSYVFDKSSTKRAVLIKKILHACIYCLDEWFEEKALKMLKNVIHLLIKKIKLTPKNESEIRSFSLEERLNKAIEILSRVYKSISFLNYVSFLFNGQYLNVWERLLGMRPVYNNPQMMVQSNASSEASVREELWQAYFSLFRLSNSLFDFEKFYQKFIKKHLYSEIRVSSGDKNTTNEIDLATCGICKNEPTTAHRSMLETDQKDQFCKHSYCYFCIKQAILEDGQYICSTCAKPVNKRIELYVKS